jgi:hypothetical protein
MGEWVKIKKTFVQKDEPSVTISKNRFSFNSAMKKLAELEKNQYVNFSVDEEDRRIAFEFKPINNDDDDFKVINVTKQPLCVCAELFKKNWISKISELKGQNVFAAKHEGKKWIITLCPSFENQIKRSDAKNIPSDVSGIYRYLDSGNIVYIGKGNIKNRLNLSERTNWKFDIIEYSIIKDDEKAYEWENYWIDKYKSNNKNQLPTYNLISGHSD